MAGLECSTLEELRELIGDCHRCDLGCARTNLVFGVGSPEARVVFVGEAPGKNEDAQGVPFVGAAGKLLDEMLAHIGLAREQVYICNVLKCRPPGNRDPEASEIESCTPFLREQIRVIDPDVLVTLGNFATKFVLRTDVGISRLHGRPTTAGKFTVVPLYHPAVALYDNSKRAVLFEDIERVGEALGAGVQRPDESPSELLEAAPDPSVGTEPVLEDGPCDGDSPGVQERLF